MRIPRSIQLFTDAGYVHQYWRCHNKEFYLSDPKMKALYLLCARKALEDHSDRETVRIHSFCVMDNHFHQVMSYENGSYNLSEFMRKAHSAFGRLYNKIHNRSGKVAEGRPKTPLIENADHLAKVQFYVEANPVRAGKIPLSKLRFYKYSTYQFYAHGIRSKFQDLICIPKWYLELGKNAKERQREYRRLFNTYLEVTKTGFPNFLKAFIGSEVWVTRQLNRATTEINSHVSPIHLNSS